jgi:hypothetical protein
MNEVLPSEDRLGKCVTPDTRLQNSYDTATLNAGGAFIKS